MKCLHTASLTFRVSDAVLCTTSLIILNVLYLIFTMEKTVNPLRLDLLRLIVYCLFCIVCFVAAFLFTELRKLRRLLISMDAPMNVKLLYCVNDNSNILSRACEVKYLSTYAELYDF